MRLWHQRQALLPIQLLALALELAIRQPWRPGVKVLSGGYLKTRESREIFVKSPIILTYIAWSSFTLPRDLVLCLFKQS